MRIGIFGGTFDPVHLGHVRLAKKILKTHSLNRFYFIPVRRSPFKSVAPSASAQDRLAMLRLAVDSMRAIKISRFELERPAPSYTIHTVRFFRRKFPKAEIFLVMGRDTLRHIRRWRNLREILKQTKLLSHERIGGISSAEIRARLGSGRDVTGLIPEKVKKYIRRRRLYRK